MKDRRGVNRGSCTECSACDDYDPGTSTSSHNCAYCGCIPVRHKIIDISKDAQVDVSGSDNVAFFAYLSQIIGNPARSSDIVFDLVLTNTGGVYNSTTGKFTVPFDGTYEIGLTITAQIGSAAAAELMVNDQAMCTANSSSKGGNLHPNHNNLIIQLKKGDIVFARCREFSDNFIFYGNRHMYCNMSGKMLFRS